MTIRTERRMAIEIDNDELVKDMLEFTRERIFSVIDDIKIIYDEGSEQTYNIEFEYDGRIFGMIIENNYMVKLAFYFFDNIPEESQYFWRGNYRLPLDNGNYNHIVGVHKLEGFLKDRKMTFFMFRHIDSFKKFYLDIKSICTMIRSLKHIDFIEKMEEKHAENSIFDKRHSATKRLWGR